MGHARLHIIVDGDLTMEVAKTPVKRKTQAGWWMCAESASIWSPAPHHLFIFVIQAALSTELTVSNLGVEKWTDVEIH